MLPLRRIGDNGIDWKLITLIISFLMAFGGFAGTWYVNSYRLDAIERDLAKLDAKVERMDEKLVRQQATYDLLVDQARAHGWEIPWQGRRR